MGKGNENKDELSKKKYFFAARKELSTLIVDNSLKTEWKNDKTDGCFPYFPSFSIFECINHHLSTALFCVYPQRVVR